jgi:hypothetical protein
LKRISIFILALSTSVVVFASVGSAAPGLKLDKKDIGSKQCNSDGAKQVVDVHFKILNDADSGFNSALAWANDTIDRQLRIWEATDGSFCAQIADHSKFVTYAGQSPGATNSPLAAGIKGAAEGGYITSNIVGTFAPTLPTHGDLGTFDDMCDQAFVCTGSNPSWADYFAPGATADTFSQWGWIYHAGKHGTWLNQDDVDAADSGDIT